MNFNYGFVKIIVFKYNVWEKVCEVWRFYLVMWLNGCKFYILVWGCLYFNGVWILCWVEENLEKYIDIFEMNF